MATVSFNVEVTGQDLPEAMMFAIWMKKACEQKAEIYEGIGIPISISETKEVQHVAKTA